MSIAGMERRAYQDSEGKERSYYTLTELARWEDRRTQWRGGDREKGAKVYVRMPHPNGRSFRSYFVRLDIAERPDSGLEFAGWDHLGDEKLPRWRERE